MIARVKLFINFLSLILGFLYSFNLAYQSFDSDTFADVDQILLKSRRSLATIKKDLGINGFTDHLLISTSPLKSLSLAQLIKTENHFQLSLGQFSLKNKHGELSFACQVFDKVIISYESKVSEKNTSDKSPQSMIIEMSCKIADNDILHLMPIKISPGQILKEPVGDGTFQFSEKVDYSIQFRNIEDEWAKQWVLKSAAIRNAQSTKNLRAWLRSHSE